MRRLLKNEEATGVLTDIVFTGFNFCWCPGAWIGIIWDLFYDTFTCIGTLTNLLQ